MSQQSNRPQRRNRQHLLEPRVSALETGQVALSEQVKALGQNIEHLAKVIGDRDKQLQHSLDATNISIQGLNNKFEDEKSRLEEKDSNLNEKFYERSRVNWGTLATCAAIIISAIIAWVSLRVAPIETIVTDNKVVLDTYISEQYKQDILNAYKMGQIEEKLDQQTKKLESLEISQHFNGLITKGL